MVPALKVGALGTGVSTTSGPAGGRLAAGGVAEAAGGAATGATAGAATGAAAGVGAAAAAGAAAGAGLACGEGRGTTGSFNCSCSVVSIGGGAASCAGGGAGRAIPFFCISAKFIVEPGAMPCSPCPAGCCVFLGFSATPNNSFPGVGNDPKAVLNVAIRPSP